MTRKAASSRPNDRRREGGFVERDDGDFIRMGSMMTSLFEQGRPQFLPKNCY
jgi:hypothetical protein